MIYLEGLSKVYYNKKSTLQALNNITYSFNDTGLYFIKGKSGSGKSTLLNLINGDITGYTGRIYVNGKELNGYESMDSYRNSIVATIYQEKNLIDHLTIYENIELVLHLQNKTNNGIIEEVAKKVGILDLLNYYPTELSGGERQKATIARAIVKGSSIILADEITSNLDSESRIEIMDLMKNISKEKLVIMVCHDNEIIDGYADYILEINNGELINKSDINKNIIKSKELNEIKPNFKSKYIFKSLFNIIKIKPIRLLITLIILIGIGAVSGVLFNLCTTSKKETHLNNFQAGKYNDLFISYGYYDDGSFIRYTIDKKALEYFDSKMGDIKYNKVYGYDYNKFENIGQIFISNAYYNTLCYSGLMELDANVARENGFTLLAGEYPDEDYEIVITEYVFSAFKKYGYISEYSMVFINPIPIATYSDLIGKTLKIYEKDFIVTGIIDTGTPIENFSYLKNESEHSINSYDFKSFIQHGIDSVLFIKPGFIEENDLDVDLNRLYIGKNNLNEEIFKKALKLNYSNNYFLFNGLVYSSVEMIIDTIRSYAGLTITVLLLCTIFLIALFINYFNYSFITNHKAFGIYRSLGVKKHQLFRIYLGLSIMLVIIASITSYPLINKFVNDYNHERVGYRFFLVDIFKYDFLSFIFTTIIFFALSTVPFIVSSIVKFKKDNYYILNMRD